MDISEYMEQKQLKVMQVISPNRGSMELNKISPSKTPKKSMNSTMNHSPREMGEYENIKPSTFVINPEHLLEQSQASTARQDTQAFMEDFPTRNIHGVKIQGSVEKKKLKILDV